MATFRDRFFTRQTAEAITAPGAILLAGALSVGGWFGWQWWRDGRFVVTTDNAYVEADAAVMAPKIAGYIREVRVVEVDVPRKRIGLSMKSDGGASARDQSRERGPSPGRPVRGPMQSAPQGAGANAFADALKGKFGR